MTHKRMIMTSLAAFTVGAAGLSTFSHAQDMATDEQPQQAEQARQPERPAAEQPEAEQPEAEQPEAEQPQAEQPDQIVLEPEAGDEVSPDNVSYALGFRIGTDFAQREVELNTDAFTEGFAAAMAGDEPRLSEEELMQALFTFQLQMQAQQQAQADRIADESRAFLEQNRQAEDVQVTDSGLQYKVIEEGEGESPEPTDTVTVHYRGTLVNGQPFDSSYDRGEPAQFRTDGVIPGWTEALQMMRPGAKWELYIPADLAYGEQGAGEVIPPNAALIFEVELLEVESGE